MELTNGIKLKKIEKELDIKCELYNDHFENAKHYNTPHAQLIIADIPYNLGNNAYASNPLWYKDDKNIKKNVCKYFGIVYNKFKEVV